MEQSRIKHVQEFSGKRGKHVTRAKRGGKMCNQRQAREVQPLVSAGKRAATTISTTGDEAGNYE